MSGGVHCPDSSAEWAWFECSTSPSIGAHGIRLLPWDHFVTTNTAIFGATNGSSSVTLNAAGLYTFEAKVLIDDLGGIVSAALTGSAISTWDESNWLTNETWIKNTSPDGTTELAIKDVAEAYVNPSFVPATVTVRCGNYDAVAHAVNIAWLHIGYAAGTKESATIF